MTKKATSLSNVYPAQGRVEVDAIESNQLAQQSHDVGGMEIAVAFADEPVALARFEGGLQSLCCVMRPLDQAIQTGRVLALEVREQLSQVAEHRLKHLLRLLRSLDSHRGGNVQMELRKRLAKRFHLRERYVLACE
jgi:hypothetical protein